ncbi:hypothetical protein DICPUDRAFT_150849 [Dictyostelium purpureum]|uniref:Uncharacterized protein n=1 Tax=Dictyostelium purpureum TaxID=5786 RepID=F0ZHE6_DICPU|nr:uncharacterized protein DICPUDRAFT_150849 [Dictyostelium purpureum]EGC36617.1 hypothetical protein DICPUDRAFT_150849 [Dictyostelium purpureum]|eukprot:XP_003286855.1 hypothetical protein DICPUDRAFT_150849 [Dictyostelium purpureum]
MNGNINNDNNSSQFNLYKNFKDNEFITIIYNSEDSTTLIPPNKIEHTNNGLIYNKEESIIEFPKDLPEGSMPCSLFLRKFVRCHSPIGFVQGLYMYGENRCKQEDVNIYNCYQIQFSSTREKRKEKMDEIEKNRIKTENEFYSDHIWKRRVPLKFMSQNDKKEGKQEMDIEKRFRKYIDNELFGYTKELYDFLSDEKNSNKIAEKKID